jgi:hypothetical protein
MRLGLDPDGSKARDEGECRIESNGSEDLAYPLRHREYEWLVKACVDQAQSKVIDSHTTATANQGSERSLREELNQDVSPRGSDGTPHAHLASAVSDADPRYGENAQGRDDKRTPCDPANLASSADVKNDASR